MAFTPPICDGDIFVLFQPWQCTTAGGAHPIIGEGSRASKPSHSPPRFAVLYLILYQKRPEALLA
jgi:hypothetical protein